MLPFRFSSTPAWPRCGGACWLGAHPLPFWTQIASAKTVDPSECRHCCFEQAPYIRTNTHGCHAIPTKAEPELGIRITTSERSPQTNMTERARIVIVRH